MPTTTGIEQVENRGFSFIPLAQSDTIAAEVKIRENRSYRVWNELESLDYSAQPLTYNPQAGEVAKTYITMAAMSRQINGKEQRVVITGDADCISNYTMGQPKASINENITLGTFHYLTHGDRPLYWPSMIPTDKLDNKIYISMRGGQVMYICLVWGLPILFGATGLFIWIRRRGR